MSDVMALGFGLLVAACVLCAVIGAREVSRAGDRRLPLLGARGPVRGADLVLFIAALVCAIAAVGVLWQTNVSHGVVLLLFLVGLAGPFVVTTVLHNRRAEGRER